MDEREKLREERGESRGASRVRRARRARGSLHLQALGDFRSVDLAHESLLEHLPVVVYLSAADDVRHMAYVSPQIERMLGFTPEEWIAEPAVWARRLHPDDRERVLAELAQTLPRGGRFVSEYRMVARDGSVRWFHDEAVLVRDENAGTQFVEGVCVDVTKRKETEEALRVSEETLRALFEASPLAIVALDPAGNVRSWSPAATRVYGWSPEEVLGRPFPTVPADRRLEFEALRGRVAAGETIVGFETRRMRRDGSEIDVSISLAPLRDSTGDVSGVIGLVADISARKRAEAALRESDERLQRLVQDLPDIVFRYRFAPSRGLEYVSPAAAKMTGYAPEEFCRDPDIMFKIVHPEDRDRLQHFLEDPIGVPVGMLRWVHPDGAVVWAEHHATPILDAAGNLIAVEGIVRDITERTRLEDRLRQAEKLEALGRLAAGIAHDFNNLATIITASADLLHNEPDLPASAREVAETIALAGERAASMAQHFLAFSRRGEFSLEPLDLNAVVDRMSGILRRIVPGSVRLVVQPDPQAALARGDRVQLERVILNLVLNASQAMPDGGSLTVEIRQVALRETRDCWPGPEAPRGRYVRLTVSDTGVGMDAETRARSFDPYFTTKGAEGGTGLGLSTAYGIVRQLGGCIDVESALGQGSAFRVYLPAAEVAAHPSAPDSSRRSRKRRSH